MARSLATLRIVREKTGGVLSFLSDYLLLLFLVGFEIATGGYGSRNVYRASERAVEEFLGIKEGEAKVKAGRAVGNLRAKGHIRFAKGWANPEITKLGKERLKQLIPHYEKKRPWDGRMYIITYDIPERGRRRRDELRELLKKMGCGMLQASVWITPYNPKQILKKFVHQRGLRGLVILSEVDKDGAIGGESFPSLVWKVYKLGELEERYNQFMRHCKSEDHPAHVVLLEYLAILRSDPQLPFELLPKDWVGREAYEICTKYLKGTDFDIKGQRPWGS